MNDARGLPLAGEWDRLDDLSRLVSLLPALPTKILNELEKGRFHLGSYESGLLGLGPVDILRYGGVDRD